MHTELKNNDQQIEYPPVPPPARFDEHELSHAKPVQPLVKVSARRFITVSARRFISTLGRSVTGLAAVLIVTNTISFALAVGFINWSGPVPANKSDVESLSQSLTEAGADEMSSSDKQAAEIVRAQKRRSRLRRQLERERNRQMFELDDEEFDGGHRARLVGTIY